MKDSISSKLLMCDSTNIKIMLSNNINSWQNTSEFFQGKYGMPYIYIYMHFIFHCVKTSSRPTNRTTLARIYGFTLKFEVNLASVMSTKPVSSWDYGKKQEGTERLTPKPLISSEILPSILN